MTDSIPNINVLDLDGVPVDLMQIYMDQILLLIIYNNDYLGCTSFATPLPYEF